MPELPEVETTCRGIKKYLVSQTIADVIVRNARLRYIVDQNLKKILAGLVIREVFRKGKYIILLCQGGAIVIHLGMSGSLRLSSLQEKPGLHDHIDVLLTNGCCLRYCDPRRFGLFMWVEEPVEQHKLFSRMGVEPLSEQFDADYLYVRSRRRTLAIKPFIMNNQVVLGVGNIYASESLFRAGIHPLRAAGRTSKQRYHILVDEVKKVLKEAISAGGTTLRDFVGGDGKPGYFKFALRVYGREGAPCLRCAHPIKSCRQGGRATFYCTKCQR
ncbi:MAG: bifunctional DNA-formamidopyrimidine glycosylase/DNA-(apurinic or apyrimidinic site) lyase [Gammaproteobacteria bacterium]|nr:bifunctional DNA-formamidopyrimidine glycosylase/DNA-(apurinic or apyrimidinic site) lyase [Gammaproteobacteria bacterium]